MFVYRCVVRITLGGWICYKTVRWQRWGKVIVRKSLLKSIFEKDVIRVSFWERGYAKDFVRKTLWESRCEKDVVERRWQKDVVRKSLWEKPYETDFVKKSWDRQTQIFLATACEANRGYLFSSLTFSKKCYSSKFKKLWADFNETKFKIFI